MESGSKMERFFTSDTHFGHENIINFCGRPFSNATEMDEALIENWNFIVKPQDHISHLGDVTLARGGQAIQGRYIKLINRLHGHKRLFLGNHDHMPIKAYLLMGFEKIYATWRDENGLLFSHIPIHPMSMGSAIANVHGHIHNAQASFPPVVQTYQKQSDIAPLKVVKPYINVCVEVTNYKPISFDEILVKIREAKEHG